MTRKPGGQGLWGVSFGLDLPRVDKWLFCPGMMFRSTVKWWGDRTGWRPRPHEGLDLLLYRDQAGRVCRLDDTEAIPAMSDGVVAGMIPDFLGRSIIVKHPIPHESGGMRYTIYAHTRPRNDLCTGKRVKRGDPLATVATPDGDRRFPMAPHLHLSTAWAPGPIPCDRLDWDGIAAQEVLTLVDPLAVISLDYELLGQEHPVCGGL